MVFSPLEDWKVRLFIIGMLGREVKTVCWVVDELLRGEVIG